MRRIKSMTANEVKRGQLIELTDGNWFPVKYVHIQDIKDDQYKSYILIESVSGQTYVLPASQLVYLLEWGDK